MTATPNIRQQKATFMQYTWPSTITKTIEIGSQHGPAYDDNFKSYSEVTNAFLDLGWRIISVYVERSDSDSTRQECVTMMGWELDDSPKYPAGYGK